MGIPLTGTWEIHANGAVEQLVLNIDNAGNVTGQFDAGIEGFWDEDAKKLVFQRMVSASSVPDAMQRLQVFTGYHYSVRDSSPGPSGPAGPTTNDHTPIEHTLAGHFEAFVGTGATAQRVRYGWYARRTVRHG
jgi:hypothetical protein